MRSTNRRTFLSATTASLAAPTLTFSAPAARSRKSEAILRTLASHRGTPEEVAQDEDFWHEVGSAFTVDRTYINFNNGGVSPSPRIVQEAMKRHLDFSNSYPTSRALFTELAKQKEVVRERMARHWGVSAEEIAITRNSSESLQICQFGLDLQPGDEVITNDQDYPRMRTTFRQRERREGITYRTFPIPVPAEDVGRIVRLFEEQITSRTKLILTSHMINITGQILPIGEIVAMARTHSVPVIVDGAHALAHFPFKLSDLDCDYYGTSLHKWLFAPHGTGLLYVRRDKIRDLWPLMAAKEDKDDDIRKFEEIGTHPLANPLAIAEALTFHQAVGDERKAARLRYLRDAWINRLLDASDRFQLNTSLDPRFSCGIANVRLGGVELDELFDYLWNDKRILTSPIRHNDQFEGLRISPSVYSTMEEIDRFCDAMIHAARNGIGG